MTSSHRRGTSAAALASAALLGLSLTACAADEGSGSGSPEGSPGSAEVTTPASGDPVKIGVNIELSGPAAVQGTAYKNAVELVAKTINDAGGVNGQPIELIIRDNKSDPTQALQVAKGMVENDNVVAIVGGGSSPTTMSTVEFVQSAKVPIVSMGSSDAIVNPVAERSYIFKTPAGTDMVMQVMIDEFKKKSLTNIGFISVDNPYGEAGLKAFNAEIPKAGLNITGTEKFQATDKDYTSIVTKLVNTKPDAIIVWAIPPGAGIVAQNVKASGFTGPVYYDPGAGAELFTRGAGAAAEGALLVHPAVLVAEQVKEAKNLTEMTDFQDAYTKAYGEYSGFASYAADALGMITQAIEDAGSTDREAIRDALETLQYNGITGVYSMSAENHSALDPAALVLVTVKDGKWALVSE